MSSWDSLSSYGLPSSCVSTLTAGAARGQGDRTGALRDFCATTARQSAPVSTVPNPAPIGRVRTKLVLTHGLAEVLHLAVDGRHRPYPARWRSSAGPFAPRNA